jgi:hypothetical protein
VGAAAAVIGRAATDPDVRAAKAAGVGAAVAVIGRAATRPTDRGKTPQANVAVQPARQIVTLRRIAARMRQGRVVHAHPGQGSSVAPEAQADRAAGLVGVGGAACALVGQAANPARYASRRAASEGDRPR